MAKEIKAKKTRTAQKKESLNEKIGYVLDLDSFEFLDKTLEDREKLFVYYAAIDDAPCWKDIAIKAGYSPATAKIKGCQKHLELQKEIDNFQLQKLTKINLKQAYMKVISQMEYAASEFDPTDAYEMNTEQSEDGRFYTHAIMCLPDAMPKQLRQMIKAVHFNARGIPEYEFINKEAAQKFIIDLYNKQNGQKADSDEFNVETTAELIKDKMVVQTKVIKRNKDVAEMTDFKEKPEDYSEED